MAKTIVDKLSKFADDSAEETNDSVDNAAEEVFEPQYRVIGEERILVSKRAGALWKSRKDIARAKIENDGTIKRWEESLRYYRNDQSDKKSDTDPERSRGMNLTTSGVETENIVFANTTSLVPAIYAKNPTIEVTTEDSAFEDWASCHERLINALLSKQHAPGINLKPKMRKMVISATLTNVGYIELGYTSREQSSEQTLHELSKLGEEYAKEDLEPNKIREIEGKLQALEAKVDFMRPSGPWCKYRSPTSVIIDPDATDKEEATWIMIQDFINTDFLQAAYGKQNEKGEYESIYKPTHILKNNNKTNEDLTTLREFSLINYEEGKNYKSYGFDDEASMKKARRTEVYYVWDKTTRRVFLYNASDWTWPLWVWDDPYGFPDFFPIEEIQFYTDPENYYARSEVSYYLDQQDAINEINNEFAKTRKYISGKFLYNKSIKGADVLIEEFLKGTNNKRAVGLDLPTDFDIKKFMTPILPPSAEALNTVAFDKARLLEAIDRISSVTNVMRGVEYKTNTTNKAIESYESNTQTRLDEKIDVIEDVLGRIGYKIGHMCIKYMSDDEVMKLIGKERATVWTQFKPTIEQYGSYFGITTLGGSTLKPTSATKKQQAIQISQAIGQFAQATPLALVVMLKILERAFDEVVVTKEDWQMITDSIMQQMQANQGGGDPTQVLQQIAERLDTLPPEAKAKIAELFAKGVPFQKIMALLVQQQQQGAQNDTAPQEA